MMDTPTARTEDEDGYETGRYKFGPVPRNKLWRSISTNLLIELQGRVCVKWLDDYDRWASTKFLYFPVQINGETRGYFRARMRKSEDPKTPSYLLAKSTPGSNWSKRWGLWPFDHSIKLMKKVGTTTMVLVEGQRDALRLITNGIPAVCIFGTQSWSRHKPQLMELAGVERVVSLFDGDDAGIKATDNTEDDLRRLFDLKIVKLWSVKGSPYKRFAHLPEPSKAAKEAGVSLWDPGNCPQWIIDKIKSRYL
jgi:5S rRNA maturation endonuclease (ribonuclease M5)